MTLAAQSTPATHPSLEALCDFHDRVADWSDPAGVAVAAVRFIQEQLPHPEVSLYRHQRSSHSLLLLASTLSLSGDAVPGARVQIGNGALGRAVRTGTPQRALNSYVEPDFVRSLPGETRSELAIPICQGGTVLGVIQLEYPPPHQPAKSDETLARLVVGPLAAALSLDAEITESESSAKAQRQEPALVSIADLLAHGSDHSEILQQIASKALSIVPAGGALLLLRHRERQALQVAAVAGEVPFAAGARLPLEETLAGAVLRDARPRIAASPEDCREAFGPAEYEIRNSLLVAMANGGKTSGVLALVNRSAGGEYSPDEVERLQSLANLAGVVEPLRSIAPLRQRLSDAALIAEVGRAMTGTLGLNDVLGLVVQAAQMLLNARGAAVGLLAPDGQSLSLAATAGVLDGSRGIALPTNGSLMGWVAKMGEAVITPDISRDSRSFPHDVPLGPGVAVPLEAHGKICGTLLAGRRQGDAQPSDEDLNALQKLGAYAAIAIDNARLYQGQKELSQALRAQTAELEKAYADLHASQNRLVVSEKMAALGRVTAGIAHEINSPLGSILNCLQLALSYSAEYRASVDDPDVSPDDHRAIATDLIESLTLAEGAARRVAQFVRTIKSQTRTGEEVARTFTPLQEIESTVLLLQHELRNRNISVHVDGDEALTLTGDPGKFAVIVQNLLSNAMDAYEETEGEIHVRLYAGKDDVRLEVEDHGSGIPEEIRPHVYDYLFTTKDVGQGTGLGLSMVHSIVASHFKGEIELISEVGTGTKFVITFPAPAASE